MREELDELKELVDKLSTALIIVGEKVQNLERIIYDDRRGESSDTPVHEEDDGK